MATSYKTLDTIIYQTDRFDINKILFFTITDDESIVIPDTDLFTIYQRYIVPYVQTYTVTDKQREYYQYKPYLLSSDVYGTPNLGWLILMLNYQECASKFRLKSTIRLIPGTYLNGLYDTIVTKSNDKLKKNWNTYLSKVDDAVITI